MIHILQKSGVGNNNIGIRGNIHIYILLLRRVYRKDVHRWSVGGMMNSFSERGEII